MPTPAGKSSSSKTASRYGRKSLNPKHPHPRCHRSLQQPDREKSLQRRCTGRANGLVHDFLFISCCRWSLSDFTMSISWLTVGEDGTNAMKAYRCSGVWANASTVPSQLGLSGARLSDLRGTRLHSPSRVNAVYGIIFKKSIRSSCSGRFRHLRLDPLWVFDSQLERDPQTALH